jgi:hypothetical protein
VDVLSILPRLPIRDHGRYVRVYAVGLREIIKKRRRHLN